MPKFLRAITCRTVVGCCLLLVLLPAGSRAGEAGDTKFRAGIELGAGSLRLEGPGGTRAESTTAMTFTLGYQATAQLSLGLALGGHSLEAGNIWDPAQGAGVSQTMLVFQYYLEPAGRGWYARGGTGFLSYWDNSPAGREDEGWGLAFALGYDFQTENFGKVGPLLSCDYGESDLFQHQALALTLSWSFP